MHAERRYEPYEDIVHHAPGLSDIPLTECFVSAAFCVTGYRMGWGNDVFYSEGWYGRYDDCLERIETHREQGLKWRIHVYPALTYSGSGWFAAAPHKTHGAVSALFLDRITPAWTIGRLTNWFGRRMLVSHTRPELYSDMKYSFYMSLSFGGDYPLGWQTQPKRSEPDVSPWDEAALRFNSPALAHSRS